MKTESPPMLFMATSKVTRVRRLGFSNSNASMRPERAWEYLSGCLRICSAAPRTASTSETVR
ncbi:MAG: hypothetical protein Q8Q16_01880, partial [Betaproteobacteria bacterium]|nr:hypothetical protein [Betaproteobacteria bacterium]